MPAKKCLLSPLDIKEYAYKQLDSPNKLQGCSLLNCILLLIMIIYGLSLSFSVYSEMSDKFQVTDEESKKCLVDFQKKNCNALKLDGEGDGDCLRLLSCVKK